MGWSLIAQWAIYVKNEDLTLCFSRKPYPTDGHPDKIDLSEAYEYGREIVGLSQKVCQGTNDFLPLSFGRQRERLHVDHIPTRLNIEKCSYPKCRLCERRCPMGAINFDKKPPVFRQAGRCVNCLLCETICPKGAIEAEFDEEAARARKTVITG